MAYHITIGQGEIVLPDPSKRCGHPLDNTLRVGVKKCYHRDSPCFDGEVAEGNHSNFKSLPYHVWDNLVVEAELSTLFTDAQVVGMQGWDGAYLLTTKDADKIGLAISRFCAKHPDARPRYDVTLADADLARLLWLDWWTRHTLTTCNLPTFYIR